jgi:hypothetical protein
MACPHRAGRHLWLTVLQRAHYLLPFSVTDPLRTHYTGQSGITISWCASRGWTSVAPVEKAMLFPASQRNRA